MIQKRTYLLGLFLFKLIRIILYNLYKFNLNNYAKKKKVFKQQRLKRRNYQE